MNRHSVPMYFGGHGGKVLRTLPFSCRILPYRFTTAATDEVYGLIYLVCAAALQVVKIKITKM